MVEEKVTFLAKFDDEAGVWYVAESSYPGLVSEHPQLDQLLRRTRMALESLREADGPVDVGADLEMHVLDRAA